MDNIDGYFCLDPYVTIRATVLKQGNRDMAASYEYGEGVIQDDAESEKWYRKAHEQTDLAHGST